MLHQGLADGKSQPGSLLEVIQFDKASENSLQFIFRNPATGITYIEIDFPPAQLVAKTDASSEVNFMAFVIKLMSICDSLFFSV